MLFEVEDVSCNGKCVSAIRQSTKLLHKPGSNFPPPPAGAVARMSFFTGGGPLSEPVRIVYRQIRESLSVDPDIMEEVDGLVNEPVTVSGNPQSKVQELQNQAEELRVAFNRKHFMECNMSIFDVGTLEAAAKRYENAKRLLEIDSNPNSPISQRTILTSIFNTMQVQLDKKRYVFFLVFSLCVRKTWSEWRFILSFSCFVILLGAGNFMFWWSLSESNCIGIHFPRYNLTKRSSH